MKKTENSSSVDNKIFISDDDLRLFFEDKYTFGYEDEQTKTFDDEIHYNYDELVKFYGFKMHFANNGKGGRFDGWNYVIGTHPYIDYNLEKGNLHKSTNKMANGGSVMSDGKFKLRGFPPIDKVELMGLYDDFKENFSSKIERFTKHFNKVHNSKLRLIDIKELMDYAKMNFVSKGGIVEYQDYKGVEIMYEPTYEEYFVNDMVFNTLEKAQNYIDSGEANEQRTYIDNFFRRGAMAKGGSVDNLKDKILKAVGYTKIVGGNINFINFAKSLYENLIKLKDFCNDNFSQKDKSIGGTYYGSTQMYSSQRGQAITLSFNDTHQGNYYAGSTPYAVQIQVGGSLDYTTSQAILLASKLILEKYSYENPFGKGIIKQTDGTNWSSVLLSSPTNNNSYYTIEYFNNKFAKGGSVKNGYMVFNYTDNLYATNEVFQTKNDAKRFIDEFKKRFVLQGYYRDSNMNKIDINDVDLYVLDADFNPYKFSEGGIVTYPNLDLNTNRNIIAKAIEFISGTGVDAESMTLEGKEIRFKYRTSNTYTTISQKLISDTISTNRKSLELRGKNFATGGKTNFDDRYYIIIKNPKGLVTNKGYYGMGYNKKEIINLFEEKGLKYNEKGEKFGGQALKEYEFFLKNPTKYDIQLPKKMTTGGMIKGGIVLASSSTKEGIIKLIAQYLYGSTITLIETDNDKIYEVHNKKGKTSFYVEFSRGKYRFIQPSMFKDGGSVDDFSEYNFQVGDKLDLGSKGIKYFKQYDGEKIIVVDSKSDLKSSKGSYTYPSSVKKVLNKRYSTGGSIENKNKLWYEVLQKFFKIFYGEYEDDTAEKHIKDSQVTTDQAKYYYENFMDKYKTERSLSDGFKIFKQSLTKEELDSIQISFNSEDYADAEEHDTQKRYSTITIKKKENFKKGGSVDEKENNRYWKPINEETLSFYNLTQNSSLQEIDYDDTFLNGKVWIAFKKLPNGVTQIPYEVKMLIKEDFEYYSYGAKGSFIKVSLIEGSWFSMYIDFENLTFKQLEEMLLQLPLQVEERLEDKNIKGYGELGFYDYGQYIELEISNTFSKGGIVVTSIKDIPNFEQRNKENKITYRGLGLGKLFNDFYAIAGEGGTMIKVDGKEYFITNTEFNTFSRDSDGSMRIRFDAPYRKN